MTRVPRKIAIVLALAALGALAGGATPLTASASADTVDDVVCFVKTRDAFVCFRWGPATDARSAQAATRAGAGEDVCVTYDFAGSEFCVLEETANGVTAARDLLREHDQCITYDFAGSQFCVVGDTIGYGP